MNFVAQFLPPIFTEMHLFSWDPNSVFATDVGRTYRMCNHYEHTALEAAIPTCTI
jgi:hypothetical protein